MSKQVKKKQHYISNSILEYFTDDTGNIYETLFDGDNMKTYCTNPNDSMCENFTYELEKM